MSRLAEVQKRPATTSELLLTRCVSIGQDIVAVYSLDTAWNLDQTWLPDSYANRMSGLYITMMNDLLSARKEKVDRCELNHVNVLMDHGMTYRQAMMETARIAKETMDVLIGYHGKQLRRQTKSDLRHHSWPVSNDGPRVPLVAIRMDTS